MYDRYTIKNSDGKTSFQRKKKKLVKLNLNRRDRKKLVAFKKDGKENKRKSFEYDKWKGVWWRQLRIKDRYHRDSDSTLQFHQNHNGRIEGRRNEEDLKEDTCSRYRRSALKLVTISADNMLSKIEVP